MTDTIEWQGRVGDAWAEEWRRTDLTLGPVNEALVDRARRREARDILDLGCGAGATSLALANVFPDATITGLDLSEALIAVARERAAGRPDLRFETGDAAIWRPGSGAFDLIVSRHGVMFFEEPERAFAHLRSLMAPGSRLLFSCFRGREENGWMTALRPILASFAPETLGAPEPAIGPFAFADPGRVRQILVAAGFAAPSIEPLDFEFVAGAGTEPIAEAAHYFARIGPVARLLAGLDAEARLEAEDQLAQIAAANLAGDRVAFRAAAWIVESRPAEEPA